MIKRILYTADATTEGGREGHARTSDGRLDLDLDVPEEMGGTGAWDEPGVAVRRRLFSPLPVQPAARRGGKKLDLTGSRVTASVGIGPEREGGLGLAVTLDLEAPAIDRAHAAELMARAQETYPYSKGTRGNVAVTLTVAGLPIEQAVA
jgi:organic hydroperoxide reductase OsmC/OhrA